jgi:hypothetical protein
MKKIIYLIILTVFATSCDDWMDIKPKGRLIPKKTEDYRKLLDHTGFIGGVAITKTLDIDLWLSDDIDLRDDLIGSFYDEYQPKAHKFEDHIYLQSEEDESMNAVYSTIYVFNAVIDEVLEANGDVEEKEKLYAEAKVHRAFAYLKLVNAYAKQYNPVTAATDLGLPMQLKPEIEGSLKRGVVKDVYDLIINDINEIYEYLPEAPASDEFWKPSKASADALLARTYLIMGNFTNALKYADTSLGLYDYLTNYNALPPHPWIPGSLKFPDRYFNPEQLLLKQPLRDFYLVYPSQEFLDLFDQDNDLRYTNRISPEWLPPGTNLSYSYYGKGSYGLTVPEMLLIRAECNARAGNTGKAMDDVNLIRKNRIATLAYVPLSAENAAQALSIVKEERRRELAFTGLRFTDIRRYNAYDNANISIVHTINDQTYTLAPGDNKWVLPFARKYIEKNPEIEQNPR